MNFRNLLTSLLFFIIFVPSLDADEREYNIYSLNLFTPTNRSFKAMVYGSPIFLRIGRNNPEEVGIDRTREIKYLKIGEMLGLTPALLGYELDNGILMTEFIEGSTPNFEKMHNQHFLQKVVTSLHKLHEYQTN